MLMVELPIPPSTNAIWTIARGRMIRTEAYVAWAFDAVKRCRILPVAPSPSRVLIEIRGGKGWRVNRDLDNTVKAIMDALVAAQRIPDDSTRHVHEILTRFVPPVRGLSASCRVGFYTEVSGEN
jgi:Holliday junction resolvase RusA-like endonuclease